jgi:hypothetical protein
MEPGRNSPPWVFRRYPWAKQYRDLFAYDPPLSRSRGVSHGKGLQLMRHLRIYTGRVVKDHVAIPEACLFSQSSPYTILIPPSRAPLYLFQS